MPRAPRNFVINIPYHIAQRGNRQQDVFFNSKDRMLFIDLLDHYSNKYKLKILAYCLMTNHVHIVGIPRVNTSVSRTMQIVNMRYTNYINKRKSWKGHLWHSRFYSTALGESHLWQAIRYVEQNPVRAAIVKDAWDYPWSSAAFHCGLSEDTIVADLEEYRELFADWKTYLSEVPVKEVMELLRRRSKSGIPYGDEDFVKMISKRSGKSFIERKRGRPVISNLR